MGKWLFNYEKFKAYRMKRDNLSEQDLENMDYIGRFSINDGADRNDLQKAGILILKDWCVYEEDE